ncbi:MAG TPA: O-antigen ligase family protein [Thermoleophilaceae bacterium]
MTARLLASRGILLPASLLALLLAYASARSPIKALFICLGVAAVALAVANVEWLLLALLAAFPWEGELHYPTETVTVVKLVGLLLIGAWLLRVVRRNETLRTSPAVLPAALFLMFVTLSLLLSPDIGVGVSKYLRYVLFVVFFFLVLQLTRERKDVVRALRVIALSSGVAAVIGLENFLFKGAGRAGGPIRDPNDFAYLMAAILPITAYLFSADKLRRPLWGACFVVTFAAMLATLSRGAIVGIAALAVWAIVSRSVRIGGIVVGALTGVGVLLLSFTLWSGVINEKLQSKSQIASANAQSREAFWDAAKRMWLDRPVTGVGPERFGELANQYVRNNPITLDKPVVHNTYLELLAECGLFALLAFVGYLIAVWRQLASGRRRAREAGDEDGWRLNTALQASLVVSIVSGVFLSEQLSVPFWLIGGLAATASVVVTRKSEEPAPAAPAEAAPATA